VPEVDPGLIATQAPIQPQQIATPADESLPVATPMPLDEPTLQATPTEETVEDQIHIVEPGDTLFIIASQYGATIESIITANNIENPDSLEVGQELLIPAPGSEVATPTAEPAAEETSEAPTEETGSEEGTHVVQSGENLYRIGPVEQMAAANDIVNPAYIDVGQVLTVPDCN
jgi:LysM repeat protein